MQPQQVKQDGNKMKTYQIKFILRCKIPSTGLTDEYQYIIEVVSNSGNKYRSYDTWHGYSQTAKDAKKQILYNISQTQAIDYILDDKILKDGNNTPYFELVQTKCDIQIREWNTTINR